MTAWDKLEFLIGNWSSPVSGQPGEGISGSSSFSYDLDRNVIVRKSRAEFAPEPGAEQGAVHQDLMIIYRQLAEQEPRAIYFDNEGHIIHYTVRFPPEQPGVIFESPAGESSPAARLVYHAAEGGMLSVEFFVAPPGGPLVSHVKGVLKRS